MTLPGIPTIYYGTEQGFTEQRAAMFAAGSGSGGRDHFDTSAPLYRFIQRATALRREHPVFSRGRPTVLQGQRRRARRAGLPDGALAMPRRSWCSTPRTTKRCWTISIRASSGGVVLSGVFDIEGHARDIVTGADGLVTLTLPARSGKVWMVTDRTREVAGSDALVTHRRVGRGGRAGGTFAFREVPLAPRQVQLVVDGDLSAATGGQRGHGRSLERHGGHRAA